MEPRSSPLGAEFRVGEWVVRPAACQIACGAVELHLRPMVMDLLVLLAEHAGQVVSKDQILDRVWEGRVVGESTLTRDIAELRRGLRDDARSPHYIATVPKRGYRLIVPIQPQRRFAQPSLAVLPFENLSGDPEMDYFSDGISDALTTELGRIRSLRVISRLSALHFKKTDRSIPEIARELKVDSVVEGSTLQAGGRVRITAQLIAVEPERHLWAQSYDCDIGDVLRVQAEVARAVADAIQAILTPEDLARLTRVRPAKSQAHLAYLRARYHSLQWSEAAVQRGFRHLQEAMEMDPDYAPAHELFALNLVVLGFWGHLPMTQTYPQARAAALKALALDPSLSHAHATLGLVKWLVDWDQEGCERELRSAFELNPSNEFAHMGYAIFLLTVGRNREIGLQHAELALDLDPLSMNTNFSLAYCFLFAGEYQQAIDQARRTLELYPDSLHAHYALGWAFLRQGQHSQAVSAFERALAGSRDPISIAYMIHAYGRAGRPGASALLKELLERETREHVPRICLVFAYAGLGERDRAFEWLEKCYKARDSRLFWLQTHAGFEPLRSDPRFDDLLRRLRDASRTAQPSSTYY